MNILLTSVGRRTYLIEYFKEAMSGVGKVYACNSEYTYSLSCADESVITPKIYDEKYISFLIGYCKEHIITAIISLFDIDVYVLSKNKKEFEAHGIFVIAADEQAIEICNDKWRTYAFLKGNAIDCPKTFKSLELTKKAIERETLCYPVVVKPRWGMGSIGVFMAEDEEELNLFTKKIRKQIFNSYLKYESNQDVEECVLFQEKISGTEYGLDVFNDFDSKLVSVVAKQKIAMRAGETDVAKTVDAREYTELAEKLSRGLKHIGNLDVDIFKTVDDKILVLELNCRFGGQYPFSHLAGVNYPKQIVKWLLGEESDGALLKAKKNIFSCKDLVPVILKGGSMDIATTKRMVSDTPQVLQGGGYSRALRKQARRWPGRIPVFVSACRRVAG